MVKFSRWFSQIVRWWWWMTFVMSQCDIVTSWPVLCQQCSNSWLSDALKPRKIRKHLYGKILNVLANGKCLNSQGTSATNLTSIQICQCVSSCCISCISQAARGSNVAEPSKVIFQWILLHQSVHVRIPADDILYCSLDGTCHQGHMVFIELQRP